MHNYPTLPDKHAPAPTWGLSQRAGKYRVVALQQCGDGGRSVSKSIIKPVKRFAGTDASNGADSRSFLAMDPTVGERLGLGQ